MISLFDLILAVSEAADNYPQHFAFMLNVYYLDKDRYLRTGLFEKGQAFNSVALGFEVNLEALFEGQ